MEVLVIVLSPFFHDLERTNSSKIDTVDMSRVRYKKYLEQDLYQLFVHHLAGDGLFDDEIMRWFQLHYELKKQRYLLSRVAILKINWMDHVFLNLSDERFRSFVRMDRGSFKAVLRLIEQNSISSDDHFFTAVEDRMMVFRSKGWSQKVRYHRYSNYDY